MFSIRKRIPQLIAVSIVPVIAVLIFGASGAALAHGTTTAGDYTLVIGFHNEPVLQGEPNSLDLFVTNTKTGEKINGLEQTLNAEIGFGKSKKQVTLTPQEGQDGAYKADVIPTRTGDYTWRIWGDIKGTHVNVSMTSSPTTFDSAAARSDISFPDAEPAATDVQASAAGAAQTAQIALVVGIIGAVLGLAGAVMGFMVWRTGRSMCQS